ncbi:hypothetical protein TIFTF001_054297 [Ficus carica]|uniref:Uncharacterized protein n=1 Tax=Ficus carica TaxID=3494 RepID=A0AA88JDX5_FICCA|nr:hypothetical protein TIFTF001_054297 [Ficus carica]
MPGSCGRFPFLASGAHLPVSVRVLAVPPSHQASAQ